MAIITGQFAAIPVFNQLVPAEGPKAITLDFDLQAFDDYLVDLLFAIEQGIIWGVNAIYYNNKNNNSDVEFDCQDTNFQMTMQARWQGFRPVLVTNPPKFVIRSTGGTGIFRCTLLNVPMPFGEWNST